jgi:hypothetical protein
MAPHECAARVTNSLQEHWLAMYWLVRRILGPGKPDGVWMGTISVGENGRFGPWNPGW